MVPSFAAVRHAFKAFAAAHADALNSSGGGGGGSGSAVVS